MLNFAANLTLLFTELPFVERFAAAKAAGFQAVECQFPYDDVSPDELAALLKQHQLQLVLINLPAGDWAGGDRGIACDPARVDEFQAGVRQALRYATATGCPQMNCLAGVLPKQVSQLQAEETLVANLRYAARQLACFGKGLRLEPINSFDVPGFLVTTREQAEGLIKQVAVPNLQLQYDLYHMHRMGDALSQCLQRSAGRIGHIQFADSNGRHQPGTGDIAFDSLFAQLAASSYNGWVSAEYHPTARTEDSLNWLHVDYS